MGRVRSGIFFGSHCVRYGIPRSEYYDPTFMGWDGPTWVVCGMGKGREAGTPFINGDDMGIHKIRDGMGWDETNVSHGGGTPQGLCRWQCEIVREIQYGTTRPQQPTPNEKYTIYSTVIICRLLSYSAVSKDEGLHQNKMHNAPKT